MIRSYLFATVRDLRWEIYAVIGERQRTNANETETETVVLSPPAGIAERLATPFCASIAGFCRVVEGSRFRRQSPKWHDGLRGEEQKWDRHAGSSPLSIRLKP